MELKICSAITQEWSSAKAQLQVSERLACLTSCSEIRTDTKGQVFPLCWYSISMSPLTLIDLFLIYMVRDQNQTHGLYLL